MKLVTCTFLVGLLASAGPAHFTETYQSGLTKQRAGRYAEAREDFEKALNVAATNLDKADAQLGIGTTRDAEKNYTMARGEFARVLAMQGVTPDQKAQAQCFIGTGYYCEQKYALARSELAKVLAIDEAPARWTVQAQVFIGHSWRRDYEKRSAEARKACADAIIAYAKVPDIPGVAPGQKADAQMAVATTLLAMKSYPDARTEWTRILEAKDLPPASKALAQVSLGKSHFFERNYAAARGELAKALTMGGLSGADKADAQLHIGLSYYEAQDYERAKRELQKVLTMTGAGETQTHEATLRLRLRKLISSDEKVLTVLFIGASHTQVWDIPRIVEVLAGSAPAGRPRILAGRFLRGGTGIDKFWEEGTGPDTARGKIAGEPWDFVAFETHPVLFGHDDVVKYATRFGGLIRGKNSKPILLEAPAFFRSSYPNDFQQNHDENLALGKELCCAVAPAGYAWMKYLGPTPTPEQRMALYHPDAVHPSKKGAYMLACSVYSAITGLSCRGLTHSIPSFAPDGISKEDATALQEAAWKAFQETNPGWKRCY